MARSESGTSGLGIPASDVVTEAGFLDHNHQRNRDDERRRRHYSNPKRASIFDLLFEEVDNTPEIEEPVKRRLKQNIRRSFRQDPAFRESPPEHPHHPPPTPATDLIKVVVPSVDTVDHDKLIKAASTGEAATVSEEILEARRIANQLRYCLSQHTETALKVSAYLRALLVLTHGDYKPNMVIEV